MMTYTNYIVTWHTDGTLIQLCWHTKYRKLIQIYSN